MADGSQARVKLAALEERRNKLAGDRIPNSRAAALLTCTIIRDYCSTILLHY